MSMFEWKQEYSLAHGDIDGQHQKLFALANDLHTAMSMGQGKAAMSKTLAKLVDYTTMHFASEERLMQKHQYPDYLAHKAEHDKLTAQVVELQKEFDAGRGVLTVGLLQFLKDWLRQHIGETDRKVAAFLNSQAA
jgi:hemerythrin-like metal-binding protein